MRKILVGLLVIVLLGVGYYVWQTKLSSTTVTLYFASKDGMFLQAESRKLTGDKIQEAVEALIKGPEKSYLSPTIPKEVTVLSTKVTNDLCTVNFNEKLITNHWGGSSGELLTVYSIVDTLTQFPGIKKVQILVEGRKVETLAGHLMLEESLEPDMSMIKK